MWRENGSRTADLIESLAKFLTDLGAAYEQREGDHRAEWQERADAEDAAEQKAQNAKKLAKARRRPKWRGPKGLWAGRLRNTEHLIDENIERLRDD